MFDKSILESITNIDMLADMLRAAYSIGDWNAMICVADCLYAGVQRLYATNLHMKTKGRPLIRTDLNRSIVYYFGYSLASKGIALQKMGKYADSRNCVEKYSELDWVYDLDDEGREEVDYYKKLAKANTYVLNLLEGDVSVLNEYVEFINNSEEEELLPGIITILESGLINNFDIEWAIEELRPGLDALDGEYEIDANIRYYIDHLYLMALYHFKNRKFMHAINFVIKGLKKSDKLKDDSGFKKLNALFVSFREKATKEQISEYNTLNQNILGRTLKDEKCIVLYGSDHVFVR